MATERRRLLRALIAAADRCDGPVGSDRLAERVDLGEPRVRELLDFFASNSLATRRDAGYEPTVTARELLELDVDDEAFMIIDVPEDG